MVRAPGDPFNDESDSERADQTELPYTIFGLFIILAAALALYIRHLHNIG